MMREEVIGLVKNAHFGNYEDRDDGVLKLSHVHNGAVLANIYVDYSDESFTSLDAALERQKDVLKGDFFRAKGSIQWNFYYYYLLSQSNYERYLSLSWAKDIQEDSNFARKKVVNFDGLRSSYPFSDVLKRVSHFSANFTDLSNEWIRILRSHDLDEVFSDDKLSTFENAIERYLQGNPIKENSSDTSAALNTSSKTPGFIEQLVLHKYRSFLKDQPFSFSSMNLLEGRNGSGKTSILEAIELVLCGRTYRHEKLPVEDADISLHYAGSHEMEKYEPKSLKRFQDREQFWYGIPPTHNRNTLYKSFNRFNFFNTDASYRFSTVEEPKTIWSSFLSLALGGKTSELGKRIDGFSERFIQQERRLQKEVLEIDAEAQKLKADLTSLRIAEDGRPFNKATLSKALSTLGGDLNSSDDEQSILAHQTTLSEAKNCIGALLEHFPDRKEISLVDIKDLRQKADELKHRVDLFETRINGLAQKKARNLNRQQALATEQTSRNKLIQYFEIDRARDMASLQTEIQNAAERLVQCQSQLKSISSVDLIEDGLDAKALAESIRSREAERTSLDAKRAAIDLKIRTAKASLEGMKSIIMELKSLGRRYMDHTDDGKCPLCESTFERAELEQRIAKIEFSGDELSIMFVEKNRIEEESKIVDSSLASMKRILSAARSVVSDFDAGKMTLGMAKIACRRLGEVVQDLVVKQADGKRLLEILSSQGFSAKEFSDLTRELKVIVGDAPAHETLSELKNSVSLLQQENVALISENETIDNDLKSKVEEFAKNNEGFESTTSEREIKDEATTRVGCANKYFVDLETICVRFPDISVVAELRNLHSTIIETLAEVTDYLTAVNSKRHVALAIGQFNAQISEKELILAAKRQFHRNAKRALEGFAKIESEFSKDLAVKNFFDQNRPVIVEIFKAIHAPNEFDDIVLEEEKIVVIKGGVGRELSKISTGQRTAVALSIFFGLHLSCPLAPKVLLFDDPIAFVDDLNVLAFLDFLRELAVAGQRQIFFATANSKLASLIRRKFDFLGPSFSSMDPLVTH
jgi:energy-coupling factor transporter ATP-binding protein EcfA2